MSYDLRCAAVRTLVRLGCLVRFQMLIQRAFVAHRLLANVAHVLVAGLAVVNLLVTLEAVVGGERRAAVVALELLEAAVELDVVLQRQDGLHLLAAHVTNEIALAGVHRVAVR